MRLAPETAGEVGFWGRVTGVAAGVGALAGAGQLGVGYGLGVLRLAREFPTGGGWAAQLTWVGWMAALAVLAGAAGGTWAARRHGRQLPLGGRAAVVAAAALGAAVTVPLTALPADSATVLGRDGPAAAAVTAVLGLVVGTAAALTALTVRLVAVGVTLLVAVVWLLALVSTVPWLVGGGELPAVRLAVLDLPGTGGGDESTVAVVGPPLLALLICGAIAGAARWRGLPPLTTALASTAAPGLLALAYLVGGPGTDDRSVQTSPYAASLIAVAVGLLTSLLVGVARLPAPRADPAGGGEDPGAVGDPGAEPFPVPSAGSPDEPAAGSSAESPAAASRPEPPSGEPPFGDWPAPDSPTEPGADASTPVAGEYRSSLPRPSSRVEPPAWARFDDPLAPTRPARTEPEPAPPPEPVAGLGLDRPVSAPPAWPAPAFADEPAAGQDAGEPPTGPADDPDPAPAAEAFRTPRPAPAPPAAPEEPAPSPAAARPSPVLFPDPDPPSDLDVRFQRLGWSATLPAPEPAPAAPAAEPATGPTPAAATPADPPPEPESGAEPARRRRLPKLRRKPKPAAEDPGPGSPGAEVPPPAPEPPPAAPDVPDGTAASPEPEPPPEPPRPVRQDEAEHLDWISSLAGGEDEEELPEPGRRRLRRDRDLSAADLPEPPGPFRRTADG